MHGQKTSKTILLQAKENSEQRLELIDKMRTFVYDKELAPDIDAFDSTFVRKLFNFPGDITTARIAKVMQKLIDKKLI